MEPTERLAVLPYLSPSHAARFSRALPAAFAAVLGPLTVVVYTDEKSAAFWALVAVLTGALTWRAARPMEDAHGFGATGRVFGRTLVAGIADGWLSFTLLFGYLAVAQPNGAPLGVLLGGGLFAALLGCMVSLPFALLFGVWAEVAWKRVHRGSALDAWGVLTKGAALLALAGWIGARCYHGAPARWLSALSLLVSLGLALFAARDTASLASLFRRVAQGDSPWKVTPWPVGESAPLLVDAQGEDQALCASTPLTGAAPFRDQGRDALVARFCGAPSDCARLATRASRVAWLVVGLIALATLHAALRWGTFAIEGFLLRGLD